MNDPKLFDAFNVLKPPGELAETIAATLRVWDVPFDDVEEIANSLVRLEHAYTPAKWNELNALTPIPRPKFPCKKLALEIFQILRIWGMTHKQMNEFVGRFCVVVTDKGPKDWKAWKPDIRPNIALPGVSTPN